MRWAWLLAVTGLSAVASANPYDYGFNTEKLVRRGDTSDPIIIKMLPLAANGSLPVRPEIRDMRKDKYTWDLYILALSMLQYVNQNHPLSWYQIAGIHGVPFRTWNGVVPVVGAGRSGYCTHSSVLFPTWHRPYLALFEVSGIYVRILWVQKLISSLSKKCTRLSTRLLDCFRTQQKGCNTCKQRPSFEFHTGIGALWHQQAKHISRNHYGAR